MSYISWYVLGSISLTSLPIFVQQWRKKTQRYVEKCNLLSETTFLPYFMTGWCVFFYQSVYFFTNTVLQNHRNIHTVVMKNIIFIKHHWYKNTRFRKENTPCCHKRRQQCGFTQKVAFFYISLCFLPH